MDISIVLLTWNSDSFIKKCLESIISDLGDTAYSYEIFIVDNGSTDATIEIINAFTLKYPIALSPILLQKNLGTTYPRNIALRKARGRFVVIMDSDVEISEDTLNRMIRYLIENKDVGIVVPKLKYPNGKLQKSTDRFPTLITKFIRFFFLKKIEEIEALRNTNDVIKEVDYAISAMWVFRREILDIVGYLDEKLFYSPEDVDYCVRVKKKGYKIIYNPETTGIHHTQEISRGLRLNRFTFLHFWGLCYYFKKHRCWFWRPV